MSTWFSRLFSNEDKLKRKRLEDKLARKKMVKYVKRKLRIPGNLSSSSSSSSLSSNASLATTNRKLRNTMKKLIKKSNQKHKSYRKSHRKSHRKSRVSRAEARQSRANYHASRAKHHQSVANKHRNRQSYSSRSSSRSSVSQDYNILANLNPEEAGALEKAIQILQNIRNKSAGVEMPVAPPSAAVLTAAVDNAVQRASQSKEQPPAVVVQALHTAADTAKPLEDATVKAMKMVEDLKLLNESQTQIINDMIQSGATPEVVQKVIAEAKRKVELQTAEAQALLEAASAAQLKAEGAAEKLDAVLDKNASGGVITKASSGVRGFISDNRKVLLGVGAVLATAGVIAFMGGPTAALAAVKTGWDVGKGHIKDAAVAGVDFVKAGHQQIVNAPANIAEVMRSGAEQFNPTIVPTYYDQAKNILGHEYAPQNLALRGAKAAFGSRFAPQNVAMAAWSRLRGKSGGQRTQRRRRKSIH